MPGPLQLNILALAVAIAAAAAATTVPTPAHADVCRLLDTWPPLGATDVEPNRRRIFLRSRCVYGLGTLTADGVGAISTSVVSGRRTSSSRIQTEVFLPDGLEPGALHRYDLQMALPNADDFDSEDAFTWTFRTGTEPADPPVLDDLDLERFEIVEAAGREAFRLEVEGSWPDASPLASLEFSGPGGVYDLVIPAAQPDPDGRFVLSRPFRLPRFTQDCARLTVHDDGIGGGELLRDEVCTSRGCTTADTAPAGLGLLLGLVGLGLRRRRSWSVTAPP